MLFKKFKYRKFDYQPRYYNPDRDPELKRKKRLDFSRERKTRKKTKNTYLFLVLIAIVIYFILRLGYV